jgi:hypothetical protein
VGLNNRNATARQLFQTFTRLLRKRFTRVGEAHLGDEALGMLKEGFRLTYDADLDRGQDLQLPRK